MTEFERMADAARALSCEMPVTYVVEIEVAGKWIAETEPHDNLDAAADEYVESRDNGLAAMVWEIHPDAMREDVTDNADRIIRVRCDERYLDYPEWMEAEYAQQQRGIAEDAAHVRAERSQLTVI